MAFLDILIFVGVTALTIPSMLLILVVVLLTYCGWSLGVRRKYVQLLLKLFEFGKGKIEIAERQRNEQDESTVPETPMPVVSNGYPGLHCNGTAILKTSTLVAPDKPISPSSSKQFEEPIETEDIPNTPLPRNRSFNTLKRDFHLSDIFEYITAGMEAIIEDEVTQRFIAQELPSWNLLTRTNRQYEFISVRLTIIWVLGFLVRYLVLLPSRVFICFVGMMWLTLSTAIIGCFPEFHWKRRVYKFVTYIAFRILMLAYTGIATYHQRQYRPTNQGICVANHTSPIDIVILACDQCYALVIWLTLCMAIVGYLPEGPFKRWVYLKTSIVCFNFLSCALSSVITYHNAENKPKQGICVANHTSPIDVLVLACDNAYALIGQRHGGFLGIIQRALARASSHIWFERSEAKDREAVTRRLKAHVEDPDKLPILIFPEGTCINNTSVMQFKKGSFEVGGLVYPVAIKYDPRFGDAFWNSSRYSMIQYLYMMMTSWAIVCDVWYLPPMSRSEGESAIDFANRVKAEIAKQGGLVDLQWDGQLKRMKPKDDWKKIQQEKFSERFKVE